jgi:hypothetical protein
MLARFDRTNLLPHYAIANDDAGIHAFVCMEKAL